MTMQLQCERCFRDPETDLIFSFLDTATLRPADDAFFAGAGEISGCEVDGFSLTDIYRHENFGMCTGSYMIAETLRYVLERDPAALAHAGRSLDALYTVYRMGMRLDRGFLPKIYGGRFSGETSTDQVLYACLALETFYPYADDAGRKKIEEMLPALVDFWVKRDYRYHYFRYHDASWQWPLVRFPALLQLAWRFSGDERFRREYDRLIEYTVLPEHCQLRQLRAHGKPTAFEIANHGWLTVNGADRMTMDTMQFDILLRHDPEHPLAPRWRDGIRIMWDEVKDSITPDGRYYSMTLFDFDTGELKRTPGYQGDGSENHGAKSAWSTMVIRAGLMALRHCPELEDEVVTRAETVLGKLNFMDCTYYDEPERLVPEQRYKVRLLSGDAVTNWLWSEQLLRYWRRSRFEQPQQVVREHV